MRSLDRPARIFVLSAHLLVLGALVAAARFEVQGFDYRALMLTLPPLYMLYFAVRLYADKVLRNRRRGEQIGELYLSVIEALAMAIDAEDRMTRGHLRRVQIFAVEMGRLMGLPTADLEALKAGAVLHDIGKLAVPEQIPCKPGPLTEEALAAPHCTTRDAGAALSERAPARQDGGAGPALTDSLTRLPNARFLFVSFQDEIARAIRAKGPLSLIELDVDNFEEVNDRYGHPAGDRILRGVARAVRGQLRDCDTCVRYAGDEFIVTVPGVGKEEIAAVQERIARAIENHKFVVAGGISLSVTASMGSATFPEDGQSFEALIAVADARMYDRKCSRRNAMPDHEGYQRFSGRRDLPLN